MEVGNGSGSESSSGSVSFTGSSVTLTPLRFFRSPVSAILEYSGILRVRPEGAEGVALMGDGGESQNAEAGSGEVSIRIIGGGEQERDGVEAAEEDDEEAVMDGVEERGVGGGAGVVSDDSGDGGGGNGSGGRGSSYQRYDIQRIARWIEQVLPFSLLLLVVFIRQHLQGILKIKLVLFIILYNT